MSKPLRFDGRVAIITGAGRGMGRAHALLFGARGAKVVVNNRSAEAANAVVKEIVDAGGTAIACISNVKDKKGALEPLDTALGAFGRVDIIVNNAGIASFKPFPEIDDEQLNDMMDTHFRSAWWLSQAAWPHMVKQRYGKIVMIASLAGVYGLPLNAHYSAAKGALFGLAQTLAREGAPHGICANTVSTGGFADMIKSEIHDPVQLATSEQHKPAWAAAPPVVWVCHEDCHATGEYFSAVGCAMSRVFMGETVGVFSENYTLEFLRDNFSGICNTEGYQIHADLAAASRFIAQRLGIKNAAKLKFGQLGAPPDSETWDPALSESYKDWN